MLPRVKNILKSKLTTQKLSLQTKSLISHSMFQKDWKIATSFLLLLVFSPLLCFSQNKAQLEKEKQQSISKIKETEKIIEETKTQKNATIGQLSLINNELSARY